jgi:hypothetical protein
MGQEILCTAKFAKQTSQGKALLETDYVLFRGDFRVKVPFAAMKSVKPRGGWLEIKSPEGALALQLGSAAEKWAKKILNPPARLDKLGVKAGMRVALINLEDETLVKEIVERGASIDAKANLILYGAEKKPALDRLNELGAIIGSEGSLWIVYPKGIREIREGDVIAAIRASGLVDVKVASFSPTHTALKAVTRKS